MSTSGRDDLEYEVERILAEDDSSGETLYLVKWLGYPDYQCTWEPYESFSNPQTLADWHQQLAQGDTLDDEDIAALQERMNAYAESGEDDCDRMQRGVLDGQISGTAVQDERSSTDDSELEQQPRESLPAPGSKRLLDAPADTESAVIKQRRLSQPSLIKSRSRDHNGTPATSSSNLAPQALRSPTQGNDSSVMTMDSTMEQANKASRNTQQRTGERFKNLRHQNNYLKLARREPPPDMTKIDMRPPEEWISSGPSRSGTSAGNNRPSTQRDCEAHIMVPSEGSVGDKPDQESSPSLPRGRGDESGSRSVSQRADNGFAPQPRPASCNLEVPAFSRPMGGPLVTARNGRTWRRGDVVVHLLFGNHAVGDVKILQLPSWLRTKLLALKKPQDHTLDIHFQERNVVTVVTFSALSRWLDKPTVAVAPIESYEDTIQATDSLAEHLETNNVAAVWEYPLESETIVMILYSCRADGWRHFGRREVTMFEPRLHLLVRNKLPGFRLASDPVDVAAQPPRPGAVHTAVPLFHMEGVVQSPNQISTPPSVESTNDLDIWPIPTSMRSSSSLQNALGGARAGLANFPLTDIIFSTNMEDLLQIKDGSKRKLAIFLAFTVSHPIQANSVQKWLCSHINPRYIYTDAEKDGWSEWVEEIATKRGLIMFHEEHPSYCDLKLLSRYLASQARISCFSLSFEPRDDGLVYCAASKIFPRGTALFITERAMLRYPEESLHAMQWFAKSSVRKFDSWRLCLIPDAVEWILNQAGECESQNQQSYIGMLSVIHKLQMESYNWNAQQQDHDEETLLSNDSLHEPPGLTLSLPSLTCYQSRHNEGSPESEDTVGARDAILLEYFCGWAASKAGQYRKFLVLDDTLTNKTQQHSWHIQFWDPRKIKSEIK
ncbi:hypothetical protein ABEF91_001445 [Exophiala dermatitidis]